MLRALRSRLLEGSMLRNVAVLVAGTAGGQAVVLLASPALTRLYTPADFGYLSVFVALMALVVVIGSLRYEIAVSVATTDEEAVNVLALSLVLAVLMSAASALLLAWLHRPLLALLHAEPLAPFLWLLPLSILGGAVYQALSYWAIRKEKFGPLGGSTVARAVIQVGFQLVLGALGAGTPGLLGGDAVGRLGSAVPLGRLAWRHRRGQPRSVSLRGMWMEAKRHRRYPAFSAVGAVLSTASLQIPALLFVALYDARIAGLIALAQRVIGAPVTLLGKSVSQVYVGQAARLAREEPQRLQAALVLTVVRLLAVAAVPTAILALAGPWLFTHVFGNDWTTSGRFVRLLAPMFLVQFAVYPVSETLNLLERQRLRLAWDIVRLALLAAVFWVAHDSTWSASAAVLAYGLVMLGSYVLLFVLSWIAVRAVSIADPDASEG
jgi:O-antigen/teichoic acid export membrane protein